MVAHYRGCDDHLAHWSHHRVWVGVRTSDDKYRFEVFANSFFNAAYFIYGNSSLRNRGNPRIMGGEVAVKFELVTAEGRKSDRVRPP